MSRAAKQLKVIPGKLPRPMPPDVLFKEYDGHPVTFAPSYDLPQWVRDTFLEPDSKLFNQNQYHLYDFMDGVQITFLWAAAGFESKGKYVAGQCEEIRFLCNKWQKWRQEQQMQEWFGMILPTYMITLDASYCIQCTDTEFCALVEHELMHIGHEQEFGMPKFDMKTGLPKLKMQGHDVEEFVDIVARYGVGNKGGAVARMVEAANAGASISNVDIAHMCGTCLKVVR